MTSPEPTPRPRRFSRHPLFKKRELTLEELSDRQLRRWAELLETIILTLATFATAWAGYQASQWNNAQSALAFQATRLLIESSKQTNRAQQMQSLDSLLFAEWANAYAAGNTQLADFHQARFRDGFQPAFDAWLATHPLTNPDAPGSPFEMAEYQVDARDEAEALQTASAEASAAGELIGTYGDRYTLITVILAGALLLAGLSNRLEWEELRAVIVGMALLVLLGCVAVMLWLPNL